MQLPTPVLAVGFGSYLRERILGILLATRPGLLEIRAVTCLLGGQVEFQNLVAPTFAGTGLPVPEYIPELPDALAKLKSLDPDLAVMINTPTGLHAAQASACISAGFDVYIERPPVAPDDDLLSLVNQAQHAGIAFFTGSQRRLEPPFRYVYDVVVNRQEFGEIASIRCALSIGERPAGWRVSRALAGGGVVIDSGYHLLDCAAWIAGGVGQRFEKVAYAYMSTAPWMGDGREMLESMAVGHAQSDNGLDLFFDLSYETARKSVYERLEVTDHDGARVSVVRDQSVRAPTPGWVTHQRSDGSLVSMFLDGQIATLDHAKMSNGANNAGPFESFLRKRRNPDGGDEGHVCSVASSVSSWELVRDIYRHASWRSHA